MALDFTKEYPFNSFQSVTIDGEAMVKVPKFYVRVYTPESGKYAGMKCWEVSEDRIDDSFHLHPAFMRNGKELDCFYIGAYSAYKKLSGNVAGSKANEDAWTDVGGLENARQYCANRGADEGWHLQTIYERSALQILALLEAGHGDSQSKYGAGNVNTSAAVKTGSSNANFHGIHELWGNHWEIVDGIKGDGSGNISIWDNKGNQTYVNTGLKPTTGNYIVDVYNVSGENYNLGDTFIPSAVAAENQSAFTDISEGIVNDNFTLLLNADYKSGATQPGIFAVKWDKSTTDSDVDIAFRIAKYEVGIPYNVSAEFIYDGNVKSPELSSFDESLFTLTGSTSATNAGTYSITITPNDPNYLWRDGSSGAKTITWSIERATITNVPSQNGSLTYDDTTQEPVWNNYDSDKMTISGDTDGVNAGNYTVSFTPTANYKWSDGEITSKNVNWSISKAQISTVPSQNGTLTYNGTEQSPTWNNFNSNELTIGGDIEPKINAGTYTATFTPNANYEWAE